MSYELRLKALFRRWQEIQDMRNEITSLNKKKREISSKLRSLSQKLPKLLDEYNEVVK